MSKLKPFLHKSSLVAFSLLIQRAIFSAGPDVQIKAPYPSQQPRITITVVASEGQEDKLDYYKNIALEAARINETEFRIPYRDDFSVFFDNRPDYHNGETTVLPTNRIVIHTEVPNIEST